MTGQTDYDVVVCGCGGAGASAAIEAHDAGASVVVLEKAPEPGGSTRESGGSIATLNDPAGAVEHYLALTEGLTPRPVMEAYVAGVMDLQGWVERNGGTTGTMQFRRPDFPHRFDHSAYADRPHSGAIGARVRFLESGIVHGGSAIWSFLACNLESRKIPVVCQARVSRLCQSAGEVTGVAAVVEGELATFTARCGVVLATGGFGANGRMVSDYVGAELPALGPEGGNTGDGVRLAQALGADLWHMNCVAAGFGYKVPDLPSAFMAAIFGSSFFLVDGEGRRYLDEFAIEHHAAANVMLVRDWRTGRMTRLPSYLIFGEQVRRSGRITTDEAGANRDVPWPEDNSDALERGWILRGASLAELATRLGLPAARLEATAAEFEREPLEPPFYGIAVWPALFNTQGGPRRDEKARVLNVEGKPIPHLFSAGELGSIWAALYPGAGNVTEALVFGRIAGRSAADS